MAKRVFVTGGAGFIGRELTKKLLANNYQVVCYDLGEQFARYRPLFEDLRARYPVTIEVGTIMDRTGMTIAMRGCDAVFHLAAMLGVRRTEANRLRCLDVNIKGSDNVLDACLRNHVDHVILASSSEVYGEPNRNPISEADELKGKTVYAVSKIAAEELARGYNQLHPELAYTVVRFFNTYGEGQVAQFVISRFVKQVLEGRNPVVYGDGKQTRSYGHVDDVTDGLLAVLSNPASRGQTFNLGNSSQVYSLRDLAQKVIDILAPGKGLQVEVTGTFDGTDRIAEREIFTRYCNIAKARTELGYDPKISIEEGIRRIAAAGDIPADWPFSP